MRRIAYLPMLSYPEAVPDTSIASAVATAALLNMTVQAVAFRVGIPNLQNSVGRRLANFPEAKRTAEQNSRTECQRMIEAAAAAGGKAIECRIETVVQAGLGEAAALQARYLDMALLGWSAESTNQREVAEAVILGCGKPCLLLPGSGPMAELDHVVVAWDASRVAARALADALPLLTDRTRVTVLTVIGEKPLRERETAQHLTAALQARGLKAEGMTLDANGAAISSVLQEHAMRLGASLLVMGGYGHSRVRDFVLGGATRGILADLRMPVLLSH